MGPRTPKGELGVNVEILKQGRSGLSYMYTFTWYANGALLSMQLKLQALEDHKNLDK
jgi:hypothetical protein